jgi:hypothetical protein
LETDAKYAKIGQPIALCQRIVVEKFLVRLFLYRVLDPV